MNNKLANQVYMIGNFPITRQEIAYNIVTDGLSIVSFEQGWNDKIAGDIFFGLGNISDRLTDDDCQAYVTGFNNYMSDGDKLFDYIKQFTYMLFTKWGVFANIGVSLN